MAFLKSQVPILTLSLLTFIAITLAYNSTPAVGLGGSGGRFVGGRTEISDVKSNKEVQDLGRFSVEEYNRQSRQNGVSSSRLLMFKEVVEAESQVVSGMKYYLKISANQGQGGSKKMFDSVVVVKRWGVPSKKLLDFAPSTN